jgi:ribosomal protein L23
MATRKGGSIMAKEVKEAEIVKKNVLEIIPRATEKSYAESAKRTYVFIVPLNASKQSIAKAISEEFKVTVTSVRVLTRKGKKTRYSKGPHQYPGTTYRRDHKFAYITVKEGEKIPIFEEEEKKEEVKDKKAVKAEAKEAKKAEKAEAKAKKGDK